MTQRIVTLFSRWLKELILFLSNITQIIDPFYDSNWALLNFDSKKWTLYLNMTHRIDPFILSMTQRIQHLLKYDSKNSTLFFIWLKELKMTHSKNWTLFFKMTQRIEPSSLQYDLQKLNPFKIWLKELNLYFLNSTNWISFTWINELNLLFKMTQGIELSFFTWLKELNLFLNIWERERLSVAPTARSLNWSKLREPFDERSSSLINSLIHLWEDTSFVLASSCAVVAQCLVVVWWQTLVGVPDW